MLEKITPIFNTKNGRIPNINDNILVNPMTNQQLSKYYIRVIFDLFLDTNDISSINLAGLKPSNISFLPIPGMNAALPINPNETFDI